jgi:hypothetical protein
MSKAGKLIDVLNEEISGPATDRNETIQVIRKALKRRTGMSWSVIGGRGTAWGWIEINSPPKRQENGNLSDKDSKILAKALGLDTVHKQGVSIPASYDYRQEYIDRAEGRSPSTIGKPYWD